MDIEQDDTIEDSIRSDLEKAFSDMSEPVADSEPAARTETGQFAKVEAPEPTPVVVDKSLNAPNSWTNAEKAEWATMTPAQRSAVTRRESEVELGFTKLDEDRNFGKSLRDVINPYMATIQAEGGNPATAIQSLLNTAYVLRTAPTAQKTALFHQLAKQYGVDLSHNPSTVQPNDPLAHTQQELARLRQEIQQQPEVFRQQQETLAVKSKIDAFAADPKNVHYEKLKPVMASLLQGGQAQDLQDAYDKASWADPDIRSATLADQAQAKETQRIADIKAKADKSRRVAVSVKGSPSFNPVATSGTKNSIREDLEAAFDEHAA
jgi:hypothetical protein